MNGQSATELLKKTNGLAIAGAVAMLVLGFLGVFLPTAVGSAISVPAGWILVIGGLAYFAYAFAARDDGEILWRLLIGCLYTFAGFYLLAGPELAVTPLKFLVAALVFTESLLELVIFFQVRPLRGSGWILFDGSATLLLSCLIWIWPSGSSQVIGIFIGIKFIVSGFTRLMYSVAARKGLETRGGEKHYTHAAN